MNNLIELLQNRADLTPKEIAYTYLSDGDEKEEVYTFERLNIRAKSIGKKLQELGLSGERIILLYKPGMKFLEAFFGCLYAGSIAVPAYPPRKNRSSERIALIIKDSNAKAILTEEYIYDYLSKKSDSNDIPENIDWVVSCKIGNSHALEWSPPILGPDDLAFLQYTSGSTGNPKGVMVSHGNIMDNQELIKVSFGHSEKTVFVGWLPLHHDMGLVGNVLQPLYLGIHCVLMPPTAFLQRPVRWLKAISKYGGTTGGAPNFAYELCATKITDEQLEGINLSTWDLAYNGSEPVRADTIDKFSLRFEKYGFKRNSFYPCYGMAECTLLATGGEKADVPKYLHVDKEELKNNKVVLNSKEKEFVSLVSCGHTWLNMSLKIVDPTSLIPCSVNEIGEIWLKGDSVAQGYWNKPELSKEIFEAHGEGNGGPNLRTGDLGFLGDDGNLYVTGRIKDLIIIRGKNLYPHDIELTMERTHECLRSAGGAAFSIIVDGEEKLCLVQEFDHTYLNKINLDDIKDDIRAAIVREYEVNPVDIVFIRKLSLPKTSSGKTQRFLAKEMYQKNKLEIIDNYLVGA